MTSRPHWFDKELLAVQPRLYSYAMSLTKRAAAARDLTQEATLRALRGWERFERGSSMVAWIFTICRNEFLTQIRMTRGRWVEDVDGIFASKIPTPAEQMAAYDLQIIYGIMDRLNDVQRVSLELVAIDGMGYEEVAELLGIPIGTVKSQVSRARSMLLEAYGGDGAPP